jgi:N-acetylglucosaminyldiphosphoundecaprenol N-acetyl-beta-D-mannosaminyltransferase
VVQVDGRGKGTELTGGNLPSRAHILGCEIDRLDLAGTVARVEAIIRERTPSQHIAVSATNVVALREDPRLYEIARSCALVNADGQGVVWASRLLGDPLPERVMALDLMESLMPVAEEHGYRIFILGAKPEVLAQAVANLRSRHPRLIVAGYRDGYFDDDDDEEVIREIREARPDMLFVALPSPKKEYWLSEHLEELGVPFVMGVGGGVDVIAGLVRRAPRFIQRSGFEWVFRMIQEPRRLFRRFMVGNAKFVSLFLREFVTHLYRQAAPRAAAKPPSG